MEIQSELHRLEMEKIDGKFLEYEKHNLELISQLKWR